MVGTAAHTWPWLPQWFAAVGSPSLKHYPLQTACKAVAGTYQNFFTMSHPPVTLLSVRSAQKNRGCATRAAMMNKMHTNGNNPSIPLITPM